MAAISTSGIMTSRRLHLNIIRMSTLPKSKPQHNILQFSGKVKWNSALSSIANYVNVVFVVCYKTQNCLFYLTISVAP